ncbi:19831_t:CDS:2, partial [Dentiscutata erythropus]
IIPPYQFPAYYNSFIKSITSSDSTSTSSSFNTSYNNSQTQPNNSSFNNNAISTFQTIKICTLNTNSLSTNSKQLLIYNYIIENNIDIFGLSETHLTEKEKGVEIYIHTNLSKYIGYIQEYQGHIICLDLFLSNNPLRDFNATPNPKLDHSLAKRTQTPESQLIKFLTPHMHDTFRLFHPNSIKFTFNIIEDATIELDHNIILLEFSILLTISSSYIQPLRKVPLWKQLSSKQIQKYQTHIDQNLTKICLHIPQIQNQ